MKALFINGLNATCELDLLAEKASSIKNKINIMVKSIDLLLRSK